MEGSVVKEHLTGKAEGCCEDTALDIKELDEILSLLESCPEEVVPEKAVCSCVATGNGHSTRK